MTASGGHRGSALAQIAEPRTQAALTMASRVLVAIGRADGAWLTLYTLTIICCVVMAFFANLLLALGVGALGTLAFGGCIVHGYGAQDRIEREQREHEDEEEVEQARIGVADNLHTLLGLRGDHRHLYGHIDLITMRTPIPTTGRRKPTAADEAERDGSRLMDMAKELGQAAARDVQKPMAIALLKLRRRRTRALSDVEGDAEAEAVIRREAAAAAKALVETAHAQWMERDAQRKREIAAARPDIIRAFVEDARALTGGHHAIRSLPAMSPSAAVARLADIAERALAAHPDLADANGARIDDLIRRHLPRLVEIHATAAREARMEDLQGVDATFQDGVEQVRASVDEALAGVRGRGFDDLRTEVAFLKARRGA